MKKSLIALAVAGVVSAPAFAATANVDVYGKAHMAVSLFDDQPAGINDVQITSNASRIGFKGAEDLGGGLSAIWQIESGVNLDEQNGSLSNRNSFVGLKGGFGTVLAGNHDTPLKLVGRAVDLFGDTMADSRNVMGGGSDTRTDNTVAYISPSFSGLSFAGAYSTDPFSAQANAGDVDDRSVYNLNATYANGPLFLGLGYGDGDGHEALGLGAHMRGAAGFTFGNFKIVGQYDSLEDDSSIVGTQAGDYDAWMLGGAFTMGNVVLKANYMEGEFDGDAVLPGRDLEQWTVGADYNLSKRTGVYALYSSGSNVTMGAGGGLSDQVGGAPVLGDDDVSVISLGMTHSF
jgi:predicted porin